jgi:hypothetical protein
MVVPVVYTYLSGRVREEAAEEEAVAEERAAAGA